MEKVQTIKELAKKIEESNEAFNAMTPAKKRVEIAKDLIARIKLGQFEAGVGSIVTMRSGMFSGETTRYSSVKDVINQTETTVCEVCAKGGLLLSYVGRVNQKTIRDIENDVEDPNEANNGTHQKLKEIFSLKQLAYIEMAFEGSQYLFSDENGEDIEFSDDEHQKAKEFFSAHEYEDNKRLLLIASNIVRNRGTFKL